MAKKKKRTYADEAKAIMNKYKLRLGEDFDKGDKKALESMDQELTALRKQQEIQKIQEQIANASPEEIPELLQRLNQVVNPQQPQGGGQQSSQFQPAQNQGPQQPGIPQGGPSGLAGGQQGAPPEIAGQSRFGCGGKLARHQYGGGLTAVRDQLLGENQRLNQLRQTSQQFNNQFMTPTSGGGVGDLYNNLPGQMYAYGGGLPMYQFGGEGIASIASNLGNVLGDVIERDEPEPNQLSFEQMEAVDQGLYEAPVEYEQWQGQPFGATGGTPTGGSPTSLAPGATVTAQRPTSNFDSERLTPDQFKERGKERRQEGRDQRQEAFKNWMGAQAGQEGDPYQTRVPWWQHAASGVGNLLMNREIDFKNTDVGNVLPRTVDRSRERIQAQRDRRIADAMIRRQAAQTGSQAGVMQNIIAGATGTQRTLGDITGQSYTTEDQMNLGAGIQADQMNMQIDAINARTAQQQEMINQTRKDRRLGSMFGAAQGYGKDIMKARRDDMMAKIMAPENYELQYGEGDTFLNRFMGISGPAQMNQVGEMDVTGNPLDEGPDQSSLQKAWRYFQMFGAPKE